MNPSLFVSRNAKAKGNQSSYLNFETGINLRPDSKDFSGRMSMQSFVINEQFSHETVIECGMLIILGFVQVVWHWCQKAAEGKGTLVHEI